MEDLQGQNEKRAAVVSAGPEEGMKVALALLEEFGLPLGLLPLKDVVEVGHVDKTGYVWIRQKNKIEHTFKMSKDRVSYDKEISCYIEKNCMKKIKGVKAKGFLMWVPVCEINVDDPPTGKIHFKSVGGFTETNLLEAFALGQ